MPGQVWKAGRVTSSDERKGQNQATFRDANETIDSGARGILEPGDVDFVPFVCECPNLSCTKIVLVRLEEYEQVRSHHRAIAALGHEDTEVERVVSSNERFLVTEKFGEAAAVHDETDPRQ